MWKLQLQTEISLISTESKYIELSKALHTTITIICILKQIKALGYYVSTVSPTEHCKLFEDNRGALTLDQALDMSPRTKNINGK